MALRFEELAWRETPMGAISLRRRREPELDVDVYEVKLDDDFLMSSLFTVAEVELARLGLAALPADATSLDVVVGGLGLGYTARAALQDGRVGSMVVVEALPDVVGWHEAGLLPHSAGLTGDPRTVLVPGDFFAMVRDGDPLDGGVSGSSRRFDAVLLDIDHSPRHVLHPSHADFYTAEGLRRLQAHLQPAGVFALWSDDPPDGELTERLDLVFGASVAHVVTFANHLTGGTSANTVYVAHAAS
jgi:spermidine synthase